MSLLLYCYYPAGILYGKESFMHFEMRETDSVSRLIEKIREDVSIDYDDLQLFTVDVPIDPDESLHLRVLHWTLLSSVFPDGPFETETVRIIISDPEALEMCENPDDPNLVHRWKLRKDLSQRMTSLRAGLSNLPSDFVVSPRNIREFFEGAKHHIHMGRPGGAPAAIFSPVLAALQRNLDHLDQIEVTCQEVDNATRYHYLAADRYDDDLYRKAVLRDSINTAIGPEHSRWKNPFSVWPEKTVEPDCCWWHYEFPCTILALKNYRGLGGDPILQATIEYGTIISQEKYKDFHEFCNFPAVLVSVAENRIDISIAVYIGEIHVTDLLTHTVTCDRFKKSANTIRLARIFKALRSCQKDLERYYDEIRQKTLPPFSVLYPNLTPEDPSVVLPVLTYKGFLTKEGESASTVVSLKETLTALYIATLTLDGTENCEVIVKITSRYNEKAHRILANAGFAPKLHFCSLVVGELYMVVMDRVDGKSIWELPFKETIPNIVLNHVHQAIHLLHEQDIVFGDIRKSNVIYNKTNNRAVVIDFDWSGIDGVDRYPVTLNPANAMAKGVGPFRLMYKTHDLWQLQQHFKI